MSGIVRRPRWGSVAGSLALAVGAAAVEAWALGQFLDAPANARTRGRTVVLLLFLAVVVLVALWRALAALFGAACATCSKPVDAVTSELHAPGSEASALARAIESGDLEGARARTGTVRAGGDVAILVVEHCAERHVGRARVLVRKADKDPKPLRGHGWAELDGRAAAALATGASPAHG